MSLQHLHNPASFWNPFWMLYSVLERQDPSQSYYLKCSRTSVNKSPKKYEFSATANDIIWLNVMCWVCALFTLQTQLYLSPTCNHRLLCTSPADCCVLGYFLVSRCSSLLKGKKRCMRWYLGYRRLRGRAPASTRVPAVSRGGDIMICQAESHHTRLPARQRSTTASVYVIDGKTSGNLMQSQVVWTTVDTHMQNVSPVVTNLD